MNDPNPATEDDSLLGTRLGRFVLLRLLGQGGMGVVYEAYDPQLDRRVALKLVRSDQRDPGSQGRARLLREAQALARVSHPNIVPIFDVGVLDEHVFLVMEAVPGEELGDWQREPGRSWEDILGVYVSAGRGLAAAHAAGLVHRDFKPSNVKIRPGGRPCVLDFGLAREREPEPERAAASSSADARAQLSEALGELPVEPLGPTMTPESPAPTSSSAEPRLTRTGAMVGTPAYMAPEQLGEGAASPASDQFSFCVSLWEAVYGQHPFGGSSLAAMLGRAARGELADPPRSSEVPDWLGQVLRRGLRLAPSDRHPSLDALLTELAPGARADLRRTRRAGLWLFGGYFVVSTLLALTLLGQGSPEFGAQPVTGPFVAMLVGLLAVLLPTVYGLRRRLLATRTSRLLLLNFHAVFALLVLARALAWANGLSLNDYMSLELLSLSATCISTAIFIGPRFAWGALFTTLSALGMVQWPERTLEFGHIGYGCLILSGVWAWLTTRPREDDDPQPARVLDDSGARSA